MERAKEIRKVLLITLLLNGIVSGIKLILGYSIGSSAVISDGFHSLFDSLSNVVGLIGISISSVPPDERHPYGHRKFETLFALGLGIVIVISCFEIFSESIGALFERRLSEVRAYVFLIMGTTVLVNVLVNRYELSMARKLASEYLYADASHTASDIFVTLGAMAGLLLYRMGFMWADGVTGIAVGTVVAYIGYKILRISIEILVDTVQLDRKEIEKIVLNVSGVKGCHEIRTRGTKESVFLDLHVELERDLSLKDAHDIAHRVEGMIKESMPNVKDVLVHVEPQERKARESE